MHFKNGIQVQSSHEFVCIVGPERQDSVAGHLLKTYLTEAEIAGGFSLSRFCLSTKIQYIWILLSVQAYFRFQLYSKPYGMTNNCAQREHRSMSL